jgi:hypothetical protein
MNLIVNHLADINVVEIVTSGLVDHGARKEIICTAWAALDKSDCDKLLINKAGSTRFFDKQMSGALSIIKLMNDLKFFTNTAIAGVYNRVEQYDEFFEVMAQLKGFSVKNFTSRDVALSWLCHECF